MSDNDIHTGKMELIATTPAPATLCRGAGQAAAGPPPTMVQGDVDAGKVKFIARVYGAHENGYGRIGQWPLDEAKLALAYDTARSRVEQLIRSLSADTYFYHFRVVVDFVLEHRPDGGPARTCVLADLLRTQSGRWMERMGL